jgi:hypothetical protein
MAISPFNSALDPVEAFNIDNALINKQILPGELRLRDAFPQPTLDSWRRNALRSTTMDVTTGATDIGTRGRIVLVTAHDADLGNLFFDLIGTNRSMLTGYYVDRRKAQDAELFLGAVYPKKDLAFDELFSLRVPLAYIDLLRVRLEGPSFTHRVAGLCATVYLTSILLSEMAQ